MIDTCSNSDDTLELELTDLDLEGGAARREFLKLVTDEDVVDPVTNSCVVWLAKKYECSNLLHRIELGIYRFVYSTLQRRSYCIETAAALEAWTLCGCLISESHDHTSVTNWCPDTWTPSQLDHHLRYGSLFVWGLTQSSSSSRNADGVIDFKKMGKVFTEIMLAGR
jgi:hypothetical protein